MSTASAVVPNATKMKVKTKALSTRAIFMMFSQPPGSCCLAALMKVLGVETTAAHLARAPHAPSTQQ